MPAHALDNHQPPDGKRLVSFWAGDSGPDRVEAAEDIKNVAESWINVYARLQVAGVSDSECVELLGKSQDKLDVVAQSTRFQALLIQYAKGAENDAADRILKSQALPSLTTLIQLRGASTTPVKDKIVICNSLLDRIYGKAPQVVKGQRGTPDDLGTASDDPVEVARFVQSKIDRLTKNLGVVKMPDDTRPPTKKETAIALLT